MDPAFRLALMRVMERLVDDHHRELPWGGENYTSTLEAKDIVDALESLMQREGVHIVSGEKP